MTPPAAGGSYVDPVFGTEIWRLSDALGTANDADGGQLTFVVNEYATMSAFNHDHSRFILQHDSYFGLYDGAGRFLANLPFEVHAGAEPRWSRSDPRTLYYLWGNQLRSLDVETGDASVVHTFTSYTYVSGRGESSLCFDGDHMVLVGDDRFVFVYDIGNDTEGQALDAGVAFDSVYMTPDDHVTVTWNTSGSGRRNGIELFDRSMGFLRQVARAGGHMDVTRDAGGDEVLVWINSADPAPICDNGVVKIRLADAQQTCLGTLDWSLAVHVSCPDDDGTCLIGSYAPSDPEPQGLWPAHTNELFQVLLDGSGTRRLAHTRSRPFNGYNYMPRASVSRDGSRAVFSSNFGLQETAGAPAEYSDAYLMLLPAGAGGGNGDPGGGGSGGDDEGDDEGDGESGGEGDGEDLGGGRGRRQGSVTRVEEDGAAVTLTGTWFPNGLSLHSGGGAILAADAGSRVRVAFRGTGIRWIGYRDEWSGIARVYVDGELVETVDTWASPQQAQATSFRVEGLPAGDHWLEIEVTGTQGPQSGGAWVWLDAFEVTSSSRRQGSGARYRPVIARGVGGS
jgi:hypothetical protein